ncbi:MAG TPA: DUF167 domain-containing protein [Actinomycetota bacterium]|nr:DUF167 domain-containing protein [Actinomycetota bacterium]
MRASPFQAVADGVVVAVFCQPGAVRTAVIGMHAGAVKVKVKAPPEGGKANDALLELLAERLGVPRSSATLLSGSQSRNKRVHVLGRSPEEAAAALGASVDSGLDWPQP